MAETMRKQADGVDILHVQEGSPQTGRADPLTGRLKLPLNAIGEEYLSLNELQSRSIRPLVGGDLSISNAGENRMNSSLPNIDRIKNSTPIIDLDDVISHEGGGVVLDDDDQIERFDVKKGLAAQA